MFGCFSAFSFLPFVDVRRWGQAKIKNGEMGMENEIPQIAKCLRVGNQLVHFLSFIFENAFIFENCFISGFIVFGLFLFVLFLVVSHDSEVLCRNVRL